MKLVHLGGSLSLLLLAACGAGSRQASAPQRAAHEAAEDRQDAQAEAQEAKKDADQARQKAREATVAERDADQNARFAAQREAQANAQANQTEHAGTPRKGTTDVQADHAVGRSTVSFANNSDELSAGSKAKLDDVAATLRPNPQGHNVIVEGYSADFGAESTNAQLSRRRAEAVANYLENKGVPRERISMKALGTENPVNTEKSERAQAFNRRVEVVTEAVRGPR